MAQIDRIPALDFLGIGGIGMSSLARWALARGIPVSGYDKTPSDLTEALEHEGATMRYSDSLEAWNVPQSAWVIYTPAIPPDHPQLLAAQAEDGLCSSGLSCWGRLPMPGKA